MKRRKVLYVLAVLFALCLLCFAGCNEDKRPTELKSDLGITVSGDRFEPGVELVTTRLKLSDERVREALKKLPEEYFSSDDSEIAAIDIALVSGGERIQPQHGLEVRVPAPLEGVEGYVVYQVIGDEVKKVNFARFDDGVIRFNTSTFSVFLFRDSMVKRSLTVVVEGPCAGNVKVEIPNLYSYTKYYLNNGEQQTFDLSGVKRAIKLSASSPENYKFIGWYESIDGVMEKEPISTDEWLEYEVKGRRTLVARTEAELSGVSGIWAFPGESNFPVGFGDGRAATQVYVRPGNAQNLDAGKLLIKAYKESEGNGVYINVSPYQYDVEGLNEIDYSKEGDYRVRFVAKENKDLVAEVVVHVSESVVNLRAIANGNGAFRVDGGKEKYNDKTFALTDTNDGFELEAERYDEFADYKFKGWYRYLDGGILGEKMSDSEKFTLRGDMGDLTVIALYKTMSAYENLYGVYQLRLFPGESGIPVDESNERGEIESLLYYRPNEAQIEVFRVEVKGLRRSNSEGLELVTLGYGDYEIDYDGLDFGKEGTYEVKFKAELQGDESYYTTISISIFKEYAALTVEFDGNGSLKGSIVDPAAGMSYGKKDMTESGKKYVLGAFMRRDYRSIVATPDEGHRFAGWYAVDENGNLSEEPISTDAEYRFTQNGKDEHIKAVFVKEVLAYVYIDRSIGDVNGVIKKGDEIIVKDPDGHQEFMGAGETLTLTAVPNDGYKFSGWYTAHDDEEKEFYSANATETFTVLKDVQIYAVFAEKNNVTIKAYVSNEYGKIGKDLPDGVTSWEDSVEITVKEGDAVQLTARPSYEYVRFAGWFDGENYENLISAEATHTFTVTENVSVYAKFDLSFTVSAKIEGGGEFADYPDKTEIAFENLPSGSMVEIKVKAKEGYEFAGWFDKNEGFFVENNLSYTAKVYAYQGLSTGNIHLVARFRKAVTELKLETGDESGFRTDENGNFITEYKVSKNSEFYAMPSAVRVLGKAGDAFELLTYEREYRIESTINYSENGMFDTSKSGDYTVTYIYLANPAVRAIVTIKVVETLRFDVSVTPAGSGYIADENGEEIDVSGFDVESGTQITLKATAYVGNMYKFVGWFDESTQQTVLISENAQHTFTVNSHMRVIAKFEANPYFIAFAEGNGTIKMNGEIASFGNGIHVDKGTQITLTAEPGENSVFVGWFDESAQQYAFVSANATETFTVNTDTRLCAKFRIKLESIEIMTESDGSYEDAIYKNVELGGQYRPDPEEILVTGVYKGEDQQASLTLGRDYTVDKGGLNYDVRGTYTVTYTAVGQPEVFAKLIIRVLAEGDYYDAWLRLPQDINIVGEDSDGVLIAEFVIGGNQFDLTKATFAAYALGQQEETTLVYSTDFTIDDGGLDYTKAGRYLVKFIPNGCPELTESIIIAVYNTKTVKYFTEITTADSGFSMDNNYNYSASYKIGDSFKPDPEQVQIYGKYYGEADSHILELGTDYVIDSGNLDYEVPGRYEITFSAVTNPDISLIMVIIVEA